ncbi:MAG: hypothetical protein HFH30_07690 [Eubacterium sp.]|nr:hypothetical protein [Eubacterium sp.]
MAMSGLLGFVICMTEESEQSLTKDGRLLRNKAGEDAETQELRLNVDGMLKDYSYMVDVEAQRLQGDELELLFSEAEKEAEKEFLADNSSLDCIEKNVSLPKSLQNGQIRASWQLDPDGLFDSDGELCTDQLAKEGTLVMVTLTLTYFDEKRSHSFGCMVLPEKRSNSEQLLNDLSDYFVQEQELNKNEPYINLPLEWNGRRLQWSRKSDQTYQIILMLGLAAAVIVYIQQGIAEQKKEQSRKDQLLRQYPDMVSKISLLLGAGMTLSGAWERIVLNYQRQLEQQHTKSIEVYEQMLLSYREMQDGIGELKVYERFGERCGTPQYRKFSVLIVQNLRKGNSGLRQILEKEVSEAFALRKNQAKKAGEEASTKILLPMMMMLCIVMVIILVPAFLTFQM